MRPNPLQIDAVLFDMDGVLMDTRATIETAWGKGAALFGKTISREEFEMYIHGRPGNDTIDLLFGDLSEEEQRELKKVVDDFEERAPSQIVPGVYEFLKYLSDQDIGTGLVTGSWNRRVNFLTARMAIDGFFIARVTRENVVKGKPDPECYLKAISQLQSFGFAAERALVFEDAVAGVKSAREAGCRCVGVTYSEPANAIRLLEFGVETVINDFTSQHVHPISYNQEKRQGLVKIGELIWKINSPRHVGKPYEA